MRCHAPRVQLEVHLESRVSRYDGLSGWPNHFCLFFDGPPRPLFISFVFSKNVHPIFGAGIQTHDLLNMSPPITTRPGLPPNSAYVIIIKRKFSHLLWHGWLQEEIRNCNVLWPNIFKVTSVRAILAPSAQVHQDYDVALLVMETSFSYDGSTYPN